MKTFPEGLESALSLPPHRTGEDGLPASFPRGESVSAPQRPRMNEYQKTHFQRPDDSWKRSKNREFRTVLCCIGSDRVRVIETAEAGAVVVSIHGHLTGEALRSSGDKAFSLTNTLVVDDVSRRNVVAAIDDHVVF